MAARYDSLGINYSQLRKADPRLAAVIQGALGQAETVLNVGAGTGSYEPRDRRLTAVEPSIEMIRKRGPSTAWVVQARAESLPFKNDTFDAAMAVLTVHHWSDRGAGLRELRRVTCGRIVVMTYDPMHRPWLTDYLPELAKLDETQMPGVAEFERWLGHVEVFPVLIPHDCLDGFLYAYWRCPSAYLDARIRSGSSSFWTIDGVEEGLNRLAQDLESGEWGRRYAGLSESEAHDVGYRLIVAN